MKNKTVKKDSEFWKDIKNDVISIQCGASLNKHVQQIGHSGEYLGPDNWEWHKIMILLHSFHKYAVLKSFYLRNNL